MQIAKFAAAALKKSVTEVSSPESTSTMAATLRLPDAAEEDLWALELKRILAAFAPASERGLYEDPSGKPFGQELVVCET